MNTVIAVAWTNKSMNAKIFFGPSVFCVFGKTYCKRESSKKLTKGQISWLIVQVSFPPTSSGKKPQHKLRTMELGNGSSLLSHGQITVHTGTL